MSFLTNEEKEILDYWFVLEDQLILWIRKLSQKQEYKERINFLRFLINLFKLIDPGEHGIKHDASNVLCVANITDNHWRITEEKNKKIDYRQEISGIMNNLSNYLSRSREKGLVNEKDVLSHKNWVKLYKIINKLYFYIYPEKIEIEKFDQNL